MKAKNILQQVRERELTDKELKRREEIADDLPDAEFKKRYGAAWKGIKMATATNMAKKEEVKPSEKEFKPHMMYDPETGKGYKADSYDDHLRMKKMGYTHEKPQEEDISELINYSRQLKDPKKEVMVMHKKDGRAFVVDRKDEPKWLKQGYIRVEQREEMIESKMGAFFLDMQIDAQEMSERDFIKKYSNQMGMNANELKRLHKEFNEEFVSERNKFKTQKDIAFRKNFTKKDFKDNEKVNNHSENAYQLAHAFGSAEEIKRMEQILKFIDQRGYIDKISYQYQLKITKKYFSKLKEENLKEENLQEGMNADTAKAILKMREKDKFEIFSGDYVPMIYLSNADRKALKDAGHAMTRDIPKPNFGTTVTSILNVANGSSRNTDQAGMYDTETDDMKGKNPAVINMKKSFKKIGYPKTVGDLVKMTGLRLNSNDPSKNEEVDNSLMAQATRVISQTAIREKIDPADIDNIATADDRKAADKNIIIQLRRAQDMQGKADVTFKDKPNKKEKIDIRVINKALDMFDKMKPNDKAKMQKTIGKSYRDLLKTVQRGRV